MPNTPIFETEEFWMKQWEALNAEATAFSGCGCAATWNSMAADYGKHHDNAGNDKRIDPAFDFFERRGVVFKGSRILDIGCGPGRYSREFVRRGAYVVALDISEKMIARLRAETSAGELDKITTLVADWKSVNLEEQGFLGAFDLVFANMTPAVSSPQLFTKLMRASKGWCWFKGWAGKRENPLLERLHAAIYGYSPRPFTGSFICAWNLVCALGFFPDSGFETVRWTHRKSFEECVNFYTGFFASGRDSSDAITIENKIRAVLSEAAIDDYIESTVSGRIGTMLWRIK